MARGPGVSRTIVTPRGPLHVVDWPGSGPPVVFLHPNRTNARVWDFVAAHLTIPNRLLALDHRGHGLSPWPAEGYDLEDYVADDIALLEQLDAGAVILVGAATGGTVALLLASQRPDLVGSLVVVDPGLSLDPDINAAVQQQIEDGYTFPSLEAATAALPFSELWDPAMRAHFAAHSFVERADGTWTSRYHKAAAQHTEALLELDYWDRVDVRCPTLVLRGDRSKVFDRDKLVRLAGLIPRSVIAEVPRADHRAMQDNPVAVAGLLDAFVRSCPPATDV